MRRRDRILHNDVGLRGLVPVSRNDQAIKRYRKVPDSLRKTLPDGDLCLPTFHKHLKHSKEQKRSGPQNSSEVLKRVRRTGCNLRYLYFYAKHTYILRACLHRVGGPQGPGTWGNPLRWGNPPVHIISHFNVITFTCYRVEGAGGAHPTWDDLRFSNTTGILKKKLCNLLVLK